jgi:hypothetical protein
MNRWRRWTSRGAEVLPYFELLAPTSFRRFM